MVVDCSLYQTYNQFKNVMINTFFIFRMTRQNSTTEKKLVKCENCGHNQKRKNEKYL